MGIDILDMQNRLSIDRPAVRRLLRFVLEDHGRRGDGVSVVFADDEFVRGLNSTYLGKDRPTDVLAFSMPTEPAARARAAGGGPERVLGDIVISTDRAAAQARRLRRTAGREILKLIAHGALHLLGHDHTRASERAAMRKLENRYVREALFGRGGRT